MRKTWPMVKESLPLLIALSLPLLGAAGLSPGGGAGPSLVVVSEPAVAPAARSIMLQLPAEVPAQSPIAGLWLNF